MRLIEEIKADVGRIKRCYELLDKNECSLIGCACSDCDYNVGVSELELFDELMEHYAEYEKAERDGRLVVLPCKIGDTVWFKTQELDLSKGTSKDVIDEYIITEIRGNKYNPLWYMASSERCVHRDFHPIEIGKTVFLTRAEAEQALKGGAE